MPQSYGAVVAPLERRPPVFGQTVPDPHVFDRAGDARVTSALVDVAHGLETLLEPNALSQHLPGGECLAGLERVDPADVPSVDAGLFSQPVEASLDGEVRLIRAEAAHRATRWIVRVDG